MDLDAGRAKIMGKGAKERFVYMERATKRALLKYIYEERPSQESDEDCLFLTGDGRKMSRSGLASMLRRLSKAAGVQNVHAHRFRHTTAIELLRNGSDALSLQRLLGHSTLDMVKVYVALADKDVANVHKRASPVERWGLV